MCSLPWFHRTFTGNKGSQIRKYWSHFKKHSIMRIEFKCNIHCSANMLHIRGWGCRLEMFQETDSRCFVISITHPTWLTTFITDIILTAQYDVQQTRVCDCTNTIFWVQWICLLSVNHDKQTVLPQFWFTVRLFMQMSWNWRWQGVKMFQLRL